MLVASLMVPVSTAVMDTKGGKMRWGGDGVVLNWVIGIDMYTLDVYKVDD